MQKNCVVDKIVEIAPINKFPKLLRRARGIIPFMGPKLKRVYKDICFLNNEIFNIKLPKKVGVIVGDKGFDLWRLEDYFIHLIFNAKNSDGKLCISETEDESMVDFAIVHESHCRLIENDEVISMTKNFLRRMKFR